MFSYKLVRSPVQQKEFDYSQLPLAVFSSNAAERPLIVQQYRQVRRHDAPV